MPRPPLDRTSKGPSSRRAARPRGPAQPVRISLIAALGEDRIIGRKGRLPWHLPADLRHFKALTLGKPVLMGRRTRESLPAPLPGRRMLVLSRDPAFSAPESTRVGSLDEALALCAGAAELMVMGGGEVYRLALPRASRLYLTEVHGRFHGDTHFPEWDRRQWREVARADHPADERNPWPYSFVTWQRTGDTTTG